MVNFKDLVKKKKSVDVTDLIKLFESFDRHASHTDLRPTQEQALQELTVRRKERDIILKISTGSGKTAIALICLQSYMEERVLPVVYLCPTVQLVEQVYQEALKLGIKAVVYTGGETYPPADGTLAKAIIISTYDKLFNAKTTFDRADVKLRPCAIALDDAHAGVEEIREAFTLRIPADELYVKLQKLIDPPCKDYQPGIWAAILNSDPNASLEVPYWIWRPIISEVQALLESHSKDDNFIFVWPFLRDILKWCRCIISARGIEIVPDILPVNKSSAFSKAEHRLFMSATLADDTVLIRELGCDISAARKPVLPKADKGIGERMVLVPSLVDKKLNREWIMKVCAAYSKKVRVVVLSPNGKLARDWESVGAKVVPGNEVSKTVEQLKNPSSGNQFVVFVQRYDGVNLPDDACRILVLDGMPYGEGITDRYDSSLTSKAGGVRNRIIYRIEQGMGRAVRSHVDYAVIILAGDDLANFIAKRDVLEAMNEDTKAQLNLALDLVHLAIEETSDSPGKTVTDMLSQCLKRDANWKQFYDEKVRKIEKKIPEKIDDNRLIMADAERQAFYLAISKDCRGAVALLGKAITDHVKEDKDKGWYLQKVASYKFDFDSGEAFEIQHAAYEKDNLMFCPPPTQKRPSPPGQFEDQEVILDWFKKFANPNHAIAYIQSLRARLSYEQRAKSMQKAVNDLAILVGAKGSMPEEELGEGPDNLWLWATVSLVIEVKNENQETLHKKDAGQLLVSLEWFKRTYRNRKDLIPIVVAKVIIADHDAIFSGKTLVLTPEKMNILLDNVELFIRKMIDISSISLTPKAIYTLQSKFGILPEQFIAKYTRPIKQKNT